MRPPTRNSVPWGSVRHVYYGWWLMIALGATIINYSSDAAVLRAGYAGIAQEVKRGSGTPAS